MFLSKRATVKCGTREADLNAFVALANLDADNSLPSPANMDAGGNTGSQTQYFKRTGFNSYESHQASEALMPRGHPFRGLLRLWDQKHTIESGHRTFWVQDMLLSAVIGLDIWSSVLEKTWRMPDMNLWNWVYQTQQFQSTMPRDRVIALLGLSQREDQASVKVSYPAWDADAAAVERGDCKIFADAAVWMMRNQKNLDVLQLSRPGSKAPTLLPSWVPDFSAASRSGLDTLLLNYHADGGPKA